MENGDQRGPAQLADSPWLWLLLFSVMALFAMAAIHGKYSRRQTSIELRSRARDAAVQQESDETDDGMGEPPVVTSLGAIVVLLAILVLLSAAKLYFRFGQQRPGRLDRPPSNRPGR